MDVQKAPLLGSVSVPTVLKGEDPKYLHWLINSHRMMSRHSSALSIDQPLSSQDPGWHPGVLVAYTSSFTGDERALPQVLLQGCLWLGHRDTVAGLGAFLFSLTTHH